MSRQRKRHPLPPELVDLLKRIKAWRETKRSGERIPSELWRLAVALADRHGVGFVARELSLDYTALKRRLTKARQVAGTEQKGDPGFVELNAAQLLGGPEGVGTVVEVSRPDGSQMVIRLGQRERLDVSSLAASFCGRCS